MNPRSDRGAGPPPADLLGAPPRGGRIWGLRALPVVFVFPMFAALVSGSGVKLLALMGGTGLLVLAAALIRRGLDATADYEERRFAQPPPPLRLAGAAAIGLAFFLIAGVATGYGTFMSLVVAGLGFAASVGTYGVDPRAAKKLPPAEAARTGVKTEQVVAAVNEAKGKIADIRHHGDRLANRELRARLERICTAALAVVDEIERDPKDLPRARRFLNVYLDGTRDVVRDYAKREQDFAETVLADNFQNVLATIERVFQEQLQHLRKDEAFDLEVAIDVLHTQLTKEGVG
jgi:hypothetical protein